MGFIVAIVGMGFLFMDAIRASGKESYNTSYGWVVMAAFAFFSILAIASAEHDRRNPT